MNTRDACDPTDAISEAPQAPPEQAVFLAILKAADVLTGELAELLKPSELSPAQYNVLRILRGAEGGDPKGMPCGRVAERMITHDPDMTRLLDRLERRSLISRARDPKDRRVVRARITGAGLKLLNTLDRPILALHRKQLGHLSKQEVKSLASLLIRATERSRRT